MFYYGIMKMKYCVIELYYISSLIFSNDYKDLMTLTLALYCE